MPHFGGPTSKLSQDLNNINRQLKSGKTRGHNPRDLTPEEITALGKKRDALVMQMRDSAKERAVNRINAHSTIEANRVIAAVSANIDTATAPSSRFFQAVGGEGSSTELFAQEAVIHKRAVEQRRKERKAEREAEQAAKRPAVCSFDTPAKRARTEASSDARNELMKETMADLRSLLSKKNLSTKGRAKK